MLMRHVREVCGTEFMESFDENESCMSVLLRIYVGAEAKMSVEVVKTFFCKGNIIASAVCHLWRFGFNI